MPGGGVRWWSLNAPGYLSNMLIFNTRDNGCVNILKQQREWPITKQSSFQCDRPLWVTKLPDTTGRLPGEQTKRLPKPSIGTDLAKRLQRPRTVFLEHFYLLDEGRWVSAKSISEPPKGNSRVRSCQV